MCLSYLVSIVGCHYQVSIIFFQFPSGLQQSPSTEEASPLVEYTEESANNYHHQENHPELPVPVENRKWNSNGNLVNLNGGIKTAAAAEAFPDKNVVKSSKSYPIAPQWQSENNGEMRNGNGVALSQAFQLTSHKQLEFPDISGNNAEHIEDIMEESDESPPYLPTLASAPSPSQDFVEKSV